MTKRSRRDIIKGKKEQRALLKKYKGGISNGKICNGA